MENRTSMIEADALPQFIPNNINVNLYRVRHPPLKELFKDFTVEEYKSILFLLMDYVGLDKFQSLAQKEKQHLFQELCTTLRKFNGCNILVELLGIMKKYKKLRLLGTCSCIYNSFQERKFNQVDTVWKMFFSLCEELNDDDLEVLKQKVPKKSRELIVTAEDWFCWAFKNKKISKTDFSELKMIFSSYSKCLEIIDKFQAKLKLYHIRIPTADAPCGIALIINYETFDKCSNLAEREGSSCDVRNLQNLWKSFGFRTEVSTNLTSSDTLKLLETYAKLDHSNYDLFVCCILSHGTSNAIYSSDGKEIPIPTLIAAITNTASTLHHKPKLFFIQACQGTYIPQGVGEPALNINIQHTKTSICNVRGPARSCDTLRVISSIDGYVSFRNKNEGSWFVKALCSAMKEYGDKHSILDVMVEVNKQVRQYSESENSESKNPLQITDCYNSFEKTLILKKMM